MPKKPFISLAESHPEIAAEADGWNPSEVTYGSEQKKLWRCNKGHNWIISPNGRTSKGGTNCPYCSNQKILPGFNDLQTLNAELASQAFNWDPSQFGAGSNKKKQWICKLGHIWSATISSRNQQKVGCPYCSNKAVLKGFNDLATTNPELASQAYEWDPSLYTERSGKKMKWQCKEGHTWTAVIGARSSMNEGCPFCTNQKVLAGFNDLATTHPLEASEADGWDPSKFNAGSIKKVSWICPLGHKYKALIRDRCRRNSGCPICSGRIVLPGFNDLQTKSPKLAKEAFGWDPKLVSNGSNRMVAWKCSENHIWKAKVSNRSFLERGCPTCSKTGFDPNKSGYLYFLSHPNWLMFQIGITNSPEKRLAEHKRLGWELIEIRGPMDGLLTQNWETSILKMLKKSGADLSNKQVAGKFDGYSEAWSQNTYQVRSINELMTATEKFEKNV